MEKLVSQTLLGCGLSEIATFSFISPKHYDKIRLSKDDPRRSGVVISNPLGEDTSVMRTTVIPSMLDVLSRNYNNRNAAASLFEISNEYIYNGTEKLPDENVKVTLGTFHPGRTAALKIGDVQIGYLGEIHPAVLSNYGIGAKAYIGQLDFASLIKFGNLKRVYKPLPRFPASSQVRFPKA